MGAEFVVFLLLGGAVVGGVAGAAFAWRSRLRPTLRAALALGILALGLLVPVVLTALVGFHVRGPSPQPGSGPAVQSLK